MRNTAITIKVLLLALAALILAGTTSCAQPVAEHPFFAALPARPLAIAHRGGGGHWPENTLLALSGAMALGSDLVEMDIRTTADGVLVLMHDETIDRTTDGHGRVAELSLLQLLEYDAGANWSPDGGRTFPWRGRGLKVPILAEVFAELPWLGMILDVKDADPQKLCTVIQGYDMEERVLVAYRRHGERVRFQNACPQVATGLSRPEASMLALLNRIGLSRFAPIGGDAALLPEQIGRAPLVTERLLHSAARRNLRVIVWTVDEPQAMRRLLDLGVDGIMTGYPQRLLSLLESEGPQHDGEEAENGPMTMN
jgi:glycerophosphoryl diester phosphodiesterase